MYFYTKDYLDFERKHTEALVKLHHETQDEELRIEILNLRDVLERIYNTDGKKS